MEKAKCINGLCCKSLSAEDDIWQVRIVSGDGKSTYAPCCSEKCAADVQVQVAAIHITRYNLVMNQTFQHMSLRDFG